jgi:rubrerythrin
MTKVVRLKVIPETAVGERVVFKINAKEPLVRGIEQVSYTCGKCGFTLAENIIPNNYHKVILQCPSCHALNDSD